MHYRGKRNAYTGLDMCKFNASYDYTHTCTLYTVHVYARAEYNLLPSHSTACASTSTYKAHAHTHPRD